jgi:glycopeptide antibiotics resistance protein
LKNPLTVRNVALALLGAAALVLKPLYRGPHEEFFFAYAGNFAVSFGLYFAVLNATARYQYPRLAAASSTLLAVEAFEVTNGFGVLANVYDPVDLLANAAGVGLAVIIDIATAAVASRRGGSAAA